MTDDIIDTIAEAIEDAERSCGPREYQQSATHVLAVLRERYAIVERDIARDAGDVIHQSLDSPRAIAHFLFAPATDEAEEADQ